MLKHVGKKGGKLVDGESESPMDGWRPGHHHTILVKERFQSPVFTNCWLFLHIDVKKCKHTRSPITRIITELEMLP